MLYTTGIRVAPKRWTPRRRLHHFLMISLVAAGAFSAALYPEAAQASEEPAPEHLGDGVFAHGALRAGNTLHLTTVDNMRFGHGQGENFTHWRRENGERDWHRQSLFPEHNPGMTSILPLSDDTALFLYVDRKDESNRRVYLKRVDGAEVRLLFEFEDGSGVLNPCMDMIGDTQVHLLLPDRTDVKVRRYIVDAQTGSHDRLPDVSMPRQGARIYDRLVDGNRLIVPVSVVDELLLLVIALDDHRYTLHSVDRFTSVAGEPPRMTAVFPLDDNDAYGLVYMRPAPFSDRPGRSGPRTGLLGEIVCTIVDAATFTSRRDTIIAGFEAEAAATHNMAALKVGPRDFLLAHTEVDRIHERHLTGAYDNYVGGFVTHWHINEDDVPVLQGKHRLPPFFSTRLARGTDGEAVLVCNKAREGDPLHLYRIVLADMPGPTKGTQ